jgi:YajG family uncharacterized lipoprotein
MRKLTTTVVLCLAAPMALGAMQQRSKKPDMVVDLEFVPQGTDEYSSIALPASLIDRSVEIRVQDSRNLTDARVLGEGTDGEDRVFPIRAAGDVVQFVSDAVARLADQQALRKSSPADRQLELRLTRFTVNEGNKAVGSTYSAEVHFAFTLKDAAGKTLSEGAASGMANRYGKARSRENCSEVLSDALREAFVRSLGDPKLQTTWISGQPPAGAGGQPSPSGGPSPGATETVEERLKKLDELLRKGLITEEEHRAARAEILKSL